MRMNRVIHEPMTRLVAWSLSQLPALQETAPADYLDTLQPTKMQLLMDIVTRQTVCACRRVDTFCDAAVITTTIREQVACHCFLALVKKIKRLKYHKTFFALRLNFIRSGS